MASAERCRRQDRSIPQYEKDDKRCSPERVSPFHEM